MTDKAVCEPSTDPVYEALRDLLAEIDRRPADTYHHESFLWRMWATGPLARQAVRARHALKAAGGGP